MKITGDYVDAVSEIYEQTPKAVFAALAVSALTTGGDYVDEAVVRLVHEWRILHDQGIVQQSPPPHDSEACPVCSEVPR